MVTNKKKIYETWLHARNIIPGTQVRGQTEEKRDREKYREIEKGRHAKRVTGG